MTKPKMDAYAAFVIGMIAMAVLLAVTKSKIIAIDDLACTRGDVYVDYGLEGDLRHIAHWQCETADNQPGEGTWVVRRVTNRNP